MKPLGLRLGALRSRTTSVLEMVCTLDALVSSCDTSEGPFLSSQSLLQTRLIRPQHSFST